MSSGMALNQYEWLDIESLKDNLAKQIVHEDFKDEIGLHIVPYYGEIPENKLLDPHSDRKIRDNRKIAIEVDNFPGPCFSSERSCFAKIFMERGKLSNTNPYESVSVRYLFSYNINGKEFIPRLVTNVLITSDSKGTNVSRKDYVPGWFGIKSKSINLPDDVNPTNWYLRNGVEDKVKIE